MDRRDFQAIAGFRPPKIQARALVGIVVALLVVWLALSTVFQVDPEEAGVVLRFGRFQEPLRKPGLNFKLPAPIDRVFKVPVQSLEKEEFGFMTDQPGVRTRYIQRDFSGESLMLTGDLNVAVVEWTTQYRIRDPYMFLFKVRNPTDTFRDMNEAVMRQVVGDRSINEVIRNRQEYATEVEIHLQKLCDQYETGIKVVQVILQDVNPPDPVKPAFNEVDQAKQERERTINEALAEFNKVIPRARGEAQQTIQQAEGYATDRVNRAKGDAALFKALLASYRRAPDVTRRRIYLETMNVIYPKVQRKVVLDSKAKNILPLLNLQEAK